MGSVRLKNLTYRYGTTVAVNAVSLDIQAGEFFALLGPSGSGKTSILRLIAGFMEPQDGQILIDEHEMQHVPIYDRNIGFVFQNYALFTHMTVAENMAFGLESRHVPKGVIAQRVQDMLAVVQLVGYEKRRPQQLSGGQQQRIALGRALITEPTVLLLDEPLGALDRQLRVDMQVELRALQQRFGITTIFVTHDQEEAMTLSDRMAVLRGGKIEQIGTPLEVYEHPKTSFVANFLGLSNTFEGKITAVDKQYRVMTTAQGDTIRLTDPNLTLNQTVKAVVRPERMQLLSAPDANQNSLEVVVDHISYAGASVTYHLASLKTLQRLLVFEQRGLREETPVAGGRAFVVWSPDYTLPLADESTP